MTEIEYEHDVFICHASEDKCEVVRPLAQLLHQRDIRVWYDEFSLEVGDNLRRKIDEGLSRSRFGIVVLSPAFFDKQWPQWELDGLVTRQLASETKLILPVWHQVDAATVRTYSPSLANITALNTLDGISHVVTKIKDVIKAQRIAQYSRVYRDQAVKLADVAGAKGLIQDHAFVRCTLVGPAVLSIIEDVKFDGVRFTGESLWPLDEDRDYEGAIIVRRTLIEECSFANVGFGFPTPTFRQIAGDVEHIGIRPPWMRRLGLTQEEFFAGVMTSVVAAAQGDARAVEAADSGLNLFAKSDAWKDLAPVLRRIIDGDRGDQLIGGLDERDAQIVNEVLRRLANSNDS